MKKEELILELKKIKPIKIYNTIPDYQSSGFLYDDSTDKDYITDTYLKNRLRFRFHLKVFDDFITSDYIEFFINSETTDTIEEAYESLADKILALSTCFNIVIMNKVFEYIKYAVYSSSKC